MTQSCVLLPLLAQLREAAMQELRQQVMRLKAELSKSQAEASASAGAQSRQAALMAALEQELGTLREQVGA
jgi:hypothetical protein